MTFIGENLPPVLFLTLLAICALMIIAGAVVDRIPEKEPGTDTDDEADGQGVAKSSKADLKKAKAEAKARKKEEQTRKKAEKAAAKAGKAKKGKPQAEPAPDTSEATEPSESTGETIDFSMPEQE
jgi:hypothetical protein